MLNKDNVKNDYLCFYYQHLQEQMLIVDYLEEEYFYNNMWDNYV